MSFIKKLYFLKTFCWYFAGLFLIGVGFWTHRYFGVVSVNQVLSTVNFDVEATLFADPVLIKRFVRGCLLYPMLAAVFLTLLQLRLTFRLYYLFVVLGFAFISYQFSFGGFIKGLYQPNHDYFEMNYVNPHRISFALNKPKSLVLIYVESLENTYSNVELFKRDLLAKLHAVKVHATSFGTFQQMPSTGWTMAGIIATQCGIPFKPITIFDNNRLGHKISHFLPTVKCLSDVLAEQGYTNVFMKGAELRFSGTNIFLENHHYHYRYGRDEWSKIGIAKREMNGWGLSDEALFNRAKLKLQTLIKNHKLFNLTLLTVDTHGPDGLLSQACKKAGAHDFTDIVECTANEVADFVNYIHQQGWLNDVNVVVVGDHLAMQNAVYDKLMAAPERTIFNLFISDKPIHKYTDKIVHFDLFPTILDFIGVKFDGGKLGLGYSAIRKDLMNRDSSRIAEMEESIPYDSKTYNKLWVSPDKTHPA